MRGQAFGDRFDLGTGLDCRRTGYARDQVPAISCGVLQVRISRDEGLPAHCVMIAGCEIGDSALSNSAGKKA